MLKIEELKPLIKITKKNSKNLKNKLNFPDILNHHLNHHVEKKELKIKKTTSIKPQPLPYHLIEISLPHEKIIKINKQIKNSPLTIKHLTSNKYTLQDLKKLSQKLNLNPLKIKISTHIPKTNHPYHFTKVSIPIKEIKNNTNFSFLKLSKQPQKISISELLKTFKTSKNLNSLEKKEPTLKINKEENEINTIFSLSSQIKNNDFNPKKSLTYFSTALKKAIKEYKPPITTISLELNPKKLGKVEIVIKQKGKELDIKINTQNPNTINFFFLNQNELKTNLINIGFNNINMNFNSNNQNPQKKEKEYKKIKVDKKEKPIIEMKYKYA